MEHIITDFNINHIKVNFGFIMVNISFIMANIIMVNISSIIVNISFIMANISFIVADINCTMVIFMNPNVDFMDRCVNIDFNGSINLKLNEHSHELTNDAINRCVRYPYQIFEILL